MGILPLEFPVGESAESLGLSGKETFDLTGLSELVASRLASGDTIHVRAKGERSTVEFDAKARLDTPTEVDYYRHGGILQYVLRQLL